MSNDNNERFLDPYDYEDPGKIDIAITPEVAKKLSEKRKSNKRTLGRIHVEHRVERCSVCKENLEIIWKDFGDQVWKKDVCRCPKCRLVFDY